MPRPIRPAHLLALVLIAPPLYKLAEWAWPASGPKRASLRAVAAGRELFNHEWTVNDPLASGDGIGPVFNAKSCLACHVQGGGGGGGPVARNVTVYGVTASKSLPFAPIGVVHTSAIKPEFQETLNMVNPGLPNKPSMPLEQLTDRTRTTLPTGVTITQRNTPALFGDGLLDAVPEQALHAEQRRNSEIARLVGMSRAKDPLIRGRVARLPDGRLGRFGWKAEFASLDDFVRAACANELGLSNPTRPQPTPLSNRQYAAKGVDLTDAQCVLIGDYLRELPAPVQALPLDSTERGRVENGAKQFEAIGCADCHTPDLGSIKGFYSNLLLHDMGPELASSTGYYGEAPAAPHRLARHAGPGRQRVADPAALGRGRFRPVPPRRPGRDAGEGDQPPRRRGRWRRQEVRGAALQRPARSRRLPQDPPGPRHARGDHRRELSRRPIAHDRQPRRKAGPRPIAARAGLDPSRPPDAGPPTMSVLTLVCSCGMKLKAPGAVPGRVGKCPRCGSLLKVPEATKPAPVTAPVPSQARRETFVGSRGKKAATVPEGRKQSDGLVMPPAHAETRLLDSLTYPLWNASGSRS